MTKTILDTGIKQVSNIIHCSDIHIRSLKRHNEYRKILATAYERMAERCTDETLIVASGDISHNKTEMSPELIDMIGDFLTSIAKLAPVLLITGNHDANLSNKHRQDALAPIVKLLNNPRIFYLQHSGVYAINDIDISVMSILDDESTYIQAKDLDGKYKIAIYHGIVGSSVTDIGFALTGGIPIEFYDGYDLVMLGDIHKSQTLQEYREEVIEVSRKDLQNYLDDGWDEYGD